MVYVKEVGMITVENYGQNKNMTPKEFLSQAWQIDARIERKIEERERLESRLLTGRITNLTGMPRGGQYDWTDSAVNLIQLSEKIDAEIADLCRIKRQVNDAIDAVADLRLRRVLELRYRNYQSWDAIAKELGYVHRHVIRLHGEALKCVTVPEK